MSTFLVTMLIAIGAVAFFALSMSLTYLFKGHHIQSEISTNKNMQSMGIKCAVQETREMDGTSACADDASPLQGCAGNCSACDIEPKQ